MNYVICTTNLPHVNKMFMIRNKKNSNSVAVFQNQYDANNFQKFLIESRCKYQTWPIIDLNQKEIKVKNLSNSNLKCPLPNYVSKFIKIKELEHNRLKKYLYLNSTSLTFLKNVSYDNNLNLNVDIDESIYNDIYNQEYISNLNKMFKYKLYKSKL